MNTAQLHNVHVQFVISRYIQQATFRTYVWIQNSKMSLAGISPFVVSPSSDFDSECLIGRRKWKIDWCNKIRNIVWQKSETIHAIDSFHAKDEFIFSTDICWMIFRIHRTDASFVWWMTLRLSFRSILNTCRRNLTVMLNFHKGVFSFQQTISNHYE